MLGIPTLYSRRATEKGVGANFRSISMIDCGLYTPCVGRFPRRKIVVPRIFAKSLGIEFGLANKGSEYGSQRCVELTGLLIVIVRKIKSVPRVLRERKIYGIFELGDLSSISVSDGQTTANKPINSSSLE